MKDVLNDSTSFPNKARTSFSQAFSMKMARTAHSSANKMSKLAIPALNVDSYRMGADDSDEDESAVIILD